MAFSKRASAYMDEINKMFKEHPEAVLTLYSEGMRSGGNSMLLFVTLGIVVGACSCAAVLAYLEHKERKEQP